MNTPSETKPIIDDEDKKDEKPSINAPSNVPSADFVDREKWLATLDELLSDAQKWNVFIHRALNGTTGEESEE